MVVDVRVRANARYCFLNPLFVAPDLCVDLPCLVQSEYRCAYQL